MGVSGWAYLERNREGSRLSPLELLEEFYQLQNGQPMGDQQRDFARGLMETIWEDER